MRSPRAPDYDERMVGGLQGGVVERGAALLALAGLVLITSRCSNVAGSPGNSGLSSACTTNPVGAAGDDDGGDDGGASPCAPPDSDGINAGCYVFDVTVDDNGFTPVILKAQNLGQVTITLTNAGTRPHDLVFGCIPVTFPGCPAQQCFPAGANLLPVQPGQSATTMFMTPNPEGIYDFRSDVAGDSELEGDGGETGIWGQFVVQ
jgi:hypothetical protein